MPYSKNRPFRFIYSGSNNGYTNMAMDEAVLTGLKEGRSSPVLRIYKWNPPTITIGYFQHSDDIGFQKCEEDGIGIVRRLTGGRAVLHHEELTYSILFTEEDFQPFKKKEIFVSIAQCLVDSLDLLGIQSRIAEKTRGNLKSANCFLSPAQYEIESMVQGKLIGSAQVIKDGVLLQHGAIPLTGSYTSITKYLNRDSTYSKNAASLNQVSTIHIGEEELLNALQQGFSKSIQLIDGRFTPHEEQLFRDLALHKYSQEEWMLKR